MKILLFTFLIFGFVPSSFAGQSTILEAEGMGCTNFDTSPRQAKGLALTDAKRDATEKAGTHLKSATLVKDFEVQSDLVQSFANASVRLIKELGQEWEKSGEEDKCLHLRIEAEVIPDPMIMKKIEKQTFNDPTTPLNVKIWVDKKDKVYKQGELIRIYLKGNKPFFARIVYRDASNNQIQLLPNPHRKEHYFNGETTYALPDGNDSFELEVTPPFGPEQITLFASTSPTGNLKLQNVGDVYLITTASKDISIKTRGINIKAIGTPSTTSSPVQRRLAEFSDSMVELRTTP